jgi:Ran GTPase-activating protein (RanGAP) involved in mRNA processing and transport
MSAKFVAMMATLHETEHVELDDENMNAEDVSTLDALKVDTSVTSIYLSGNAIGDEGASALADALMVNTSVTSIDLSSNQISDMGASALADALKVNRLVTSINLAGNGIGAEGAFALADALKENTSVTTINLGSNGIGAEGASALADALKVNTSLTSINLDYKQIGTEASALADALAVNTSVAIFVLHGNGIDAATDTVVKELLARNERLRCLFLFDARQLLLASFRGCADEFNVTWSYFVDSGDTVGIDVAPAPEHIEALRVEFAAVVDERRRRASAAASTAVD